MRQTRNAKRGMKSKNLTDMGQTKMKRISNGHPITSGQSTHDSTTQRLNDSHAAPAAGLYVHVPFCRTKCLYCDFYSTTDDSLVDTWLQAIDQEMRLYKECFNVFDSLYIGGGTPSLLDTARITLLFSSLRNHFTFLPDSEITVEINPDDAGIERFRTLKSLGVNRLSIGVQSFVDDELAFLRRRHTAAAAERALEMAREAGFSHIGIDLIYGLPGQTKRGWRNTLERALSFAPKHLSCYQLTVEETTPLGLKVSRGEVRMPEGEQERALFLLTSRFLQEHGFVHYEVSNFAVSSDFFCRHNRKYWRHVPYLGLGPAAHSFDGGQRWWDHKTVER